MVAIDVHRVSLDPASGTVCLNQPRRDEAIRQETVDPTGFKLQDILYIRVHLFSQLLEFRVLHGLNEFIAIEIISRYTQPKSTADHVFEIGEMVFLQVFPADEQPHGFISIGLRKPGIRLPLRSTGSARHHLDGLPGTQLFQ